MRVKDYERVCARVDLDAVEYNIEMMKNNIKDDARMIVVVKTDGYGHGALPIAKVLSAKRYIWGFAVATVDEAFYLRKGGVTKPVLVLGCIFPHKREISIANDIRITVYTFEMAKEISDLAGEMGKKAYIHIKIDTGMSRLGFMVNEESVDEIAKIAALPNLILEGMFTHFSKADEVDKSFTEQQIEKFLWMKKELSGREITFRYYHCSNSAGIIDLPDANMDLVRAGISTYGLYPSNEVDREKVLLKPALELISHVAHVKWVEEGTLVSYGGTYITDKRTKIATVPVGYGDGYPRSLSDKGFVLIHGQRVKILGRICMDQLMIDVTDIDHVKFEDKVTLIGQDGEENITVEELSELSGRFSYEFVCDLGKRIPHEYLRHGEVIEQRDYF